MEGESFTDVKQAAPVDDEKKAQARRVSIQEGSLYGIMDGFGLRNITPFALAIGATNAHIGFLTSIPSLLGTISQLWTNRAMERFSRKRIVATMVLLQALMWLPIIIVGALYFVFEIRSVLLPLALVACYTLLTLFGAFAGPAWSSWMRDIVLTNGGAYFGRRNRICGFVALVAMLVGGLVLDHFQQTNLFLGFFILLIIACICRGIGGLLFTRKHEPTLERHPGYSFSLAQFVKAMPRNNFGKFTLYQAMITLAVTIGSPFVAVYMLKELHFSYTMFTIVTMGSAVATLLFMPAWGKFGDRYGNLVSIRVTGYLIPVVTLLWALSPVVAKNAPMLLVPYLFLTDTFSGFAWAGFNLGTSRYVAEAVTPQRMGLCVAYGNIINGAGAFIGAAAGGIVASLNAPWGVSALILVFIISTIGRLLATLLMSHRIREVKMVQPFNARIAKDKLLALRPEGILRYLDIVK